MQIIRETISITELKAMAEKMFGNLVKAVVDNSYSSTEQSWHNYFYAFTYAARLNR